MAARLRTKYKKEIVPELNKKFNFESIMQVPRLEKIVLNVGMGEAHTNPKALEAAVEELALITGQRPVKTKAKKSIAGFKIREGMSLGCMVTLRGDYMYEFLDRLVNVALPRVRDFKGVNDKGFDGRGNYNMSIKEQIIFPEIKVDKINTLYGINMTFVTNSKSNEEAFSLLAAFGMPYRNQK
ncbi:MULTISPECIES: 50S ribosomal protein L5 [Leptospira]|uniref:Large ribosomal subunit protein uL5 n=10 Tax=Leptospira TaxID=171 RepID=A0A4R9L4P6_9LEPT|nr:MULTISPECIES: 50S ribosomal protein L5 [Leptospira]AOP35164.1 50S ribosomal protein L5 [Leptospira tipperaryensis]ASV12549.1 50S ribosomal protein L5 [Leptospira santarosai]AVV49100.1 50S ribosomal protein L5 [Leptospira santarosai]AVV79689.1 50S ribosomal protein L5 [Leptospira santarosai]EKO35254.1 ribosomal protein L5 [Leptospira santarosai str. MOR084]